MWKHGRVSGRRGGPYGLQERGNVYGGVGENHVGVGGSGVGHDCAGVLPSAACGAAPRNTERDGPTLTNADQHLPALTSTDEY